MTELVQDSGPGHFLDTIVNGAYWRLKVRLSLLLAYLLLIRIVTRPAPLEVHVVEQMNNLYLCHHVHFIHGPSEKWQGWLDIEAITE